MTDNGFRDRRTRAQLLTRPYAERPRPTGFCTRFAKTSTNSSTKFRGCCQEKGITPATPDMQALRSTERRRSRTYPPTGYAGLPILKTEPACLGYGLRVPAVDPTVTVHRRAVPLPGGNKMSTARRGQAQHAGAKMAKIKPIRGQAKPAETPCAEFGSRGGAGSNPAVPTEKGLQNGHIFVICAALKRRQRAECQQETRPPTDAGLAQMQGRI
jgi:hypothetical protein